MSASGKNYANVRITEIWHEKRRKLEEKHTKVDKVKLARYKKLLAKFKKQLTTIMNTPELEFTKQGAKTKVINILYPIEDFVKRPSRVDKKAFDKDMAKLNRAKTKALDKIMFGDCKEIGKVVESFLKA